MLVFKPSPEFGLQLAKLTRQKTIDFQESMDALRRVDVVLGIWEKVNEDNKYLLKPGVKVRANDIEYVLKNWNGKFWETYTTPICLLEAGLPKYVSYEPWEILITEKPVQEKPTEMKGVYASYRNSNSIVRLTAIHEYTVEFEVLDKKITKDSRDKQRFIETFVPHTRTLEQMILWQEAKYGEPPPKDYSYPTLGGRRI